MRRIFHPGRFSSVAIAAILTGSAVSQLAPAASKPTDPDKAEQAYVTGARLLDRQDLAGAQAQFAKAAQLDPAHADYLLALTLTREHRVSELVHQAALARMTNHPKQADTLLAEARGIDPENELVVEHSDQATQPITPRTKITPTPEYRYTMPIELEPDQAPQDLHLRGDAKQVVTRGALAYGIKVVFDDSVTAQDRPVRFDLDQTPYRQAMPILLRMTRLFAVPLDTKTLIISKDTEENRMKYERLVEETIYIPGSDTKSMDELSNIIKNVFDVKQIVVSQSSGTIAIRAPAPTLESVNYTLADMLDGGAEVVLEIKLVSLDKTITRNIGIVPPTSASAFSAYQEVQTFVSTNQSLVTAAISSGLFTPSGTAAQQIIEEAAYLLLSGAATDANLTNVISFFGGGLTLFGASIGSGATLNLALNSAESHALDDVTVRIGDRQTTTLRIGEKYPVTTASYSSGLSSATTAALAGVKINGTSAAALAAQYLGSASTATVPQVQYEDLGITLKTTPTVMRSNLIQLHIDLKLEALQGASLNNIPVLTSSNFVSDITVQEGQTAIMLSDLSRSEAASISGLPGLGELPGFQETVSDTSKEQEHSELIMLVTPHLVRRRANNLASRAIPFHSSVPAEY